MSKPKSQKPVKIRSVQPNTPNVLILDDDPFNLFGLSSILKSLGIKHCQEVSGQKGLDRIEESYKLDNQRINYVLTDLNMPGMSGIELI